MFCGNCGHECSVDDANLQYNTLASDCCEATIYHDEELINEYCWFEYADEEECNTADSLNDRERESKDLRDHENGIQ